ncbi:MAG: hypothetical protein ACLFMO_01520 [Eubacteriales bacterium]
MKNKVLVCITIQQNSMRLIKEGSELASKENAELHILHIEKGMSIFDQEEAVILLEKLFEMGKELGGEVHFISDQDIPTRIVKTIKDLKITHLLLGETMENKVRQLLKKDVRNKIINSLDDVKIIILDRE